MGHPHWPTRIEHVLNSLSSGPRFKLSELRAAYASLSGAGSISRLSQLLIGAALMNDRNTKFKPGVSGNEAAKWKPGQSGNPAGKSKRRMQFEEAFNEALLSEGGPEEAARLLWEAARAKEPWAIQELCRRFAPQAQSLHLIHEVENEAIDFTKLTDDQLRQLDAILEQAGAQPPSSTGRDGAAKPL
jgi:hypothetical protein